MSNYDQLKQQLTDMRRQREAWETRMQHSSTLRAERDRQRKKTAAERAAWEAEVQKISAEQDERERRLDAIGVEQAERERRLDAIGTEQAEREQRLKETAAAQEKLDLQLTADRAVWDSQRQNNLLAQGLQPEITVEPKWPMETFYTVKRFTLKLFDQLEALLSRWYEQRRQ